MATAAARALGQLMIGLPTLKVGCNRFTRSLIKHSLVLGLYIQGEEDSTISPDLIPAKLAWWWFLWHPVAVFEFCLSLIKWPNLLT